MLASNFLDAQLGHIHSRSHDVIQRIFTGMQLFKLDNLSEAWQGYAADLASVFPMITFFTRALTNDAEVLLRERMPDDECE